MTGDWRRVLEEAGVVVRAIKLAGEVVDFYHMHRGSADTIAAYMQNETKPFYKRKLFGVF